ncbi:MAG TPA: SgcJ/EcaC family oxidoreductase [Pirellulales bacterium]
MRKAIPLVLSAAMVTGVAWYLHAADQAAAPSATAPSATAPSPEEKALRATCESYVKDVNSGDVQAIVKHWTEDADYINDSGVKFKGRAALAKLFRDNLPSVKGKKFAFETQSLRMISPGVAIEDGIGRVTGGDEDEEQPGSRYSAVWVRTGDQWLLSSVRDLGDLPQEETSGTPLKQLDWLVGDWQGEKADANVEMNCAWALEGKFLKQKYGVTAKDGQKFSVVTLITWDPSEKRIRSWFFDSRGGFGEGVWSREGSTWTIHSQGIINDGREGTATNMWKYTDDKTAIWDSKDRMLDGLPMPDSEVKFVRKGEGEGPKVESKVDSVMKPDSMPKSDSPKK